MFVEEAPRELLRLEHWGCPWSRQPDGRIAVRAFGGMKNKRTWFAADKTGFHMLHTLFQTLLKYGDIARYDEWFVTKLLVDDGAVHGVVALELATGRIETITAKAGHPGHRRLRPRLPFTTNATINTGDGMSLAYRAGAPPERHGVRPVPPDRSAVHGHPHHRGRAGRGRLADQQGRLPLPAGLRPRHANPHAGNAQHGARSARPPLAGIRVRVGEGPDRPDAARRRRVPRSAASRRGGHRRAAPVRERALRQVREPRPGARAGAGPAGGPLHEGGVHTDINGATPFEACSPRARQHA